MIFPTVGRMVLYYPGSDDVGYAGMPLAATIAWVNSPTEVNLSVLSPDGEPYARRGVRLAQDEDIDPLPMGGYAAWMPYQKGQAAKTEAAERAAAEANGSKPAIP